MSDKNEAIGEETLPEGQPATKPGKKRNGGINPRIAAQHLPVLQIKPQELTKHFQMRDRLNAEELLTPLRRNFQVVDQLAIERDNLKTRIVELETANATLQDELARLKTAK